MRVTSAVRERRFQRVNAKQNQVTIFFPNSGGYSLQSYQISSQIGWRLVSEPRFLGYLHD